jgi:hypothetical protein
MKSTRRRGESKAHFPFLPFPSALCLFPPKTQSQSHPETKRSTTTSFPSPRITTMGKSRHRPSPSLLPLASKSSRHNPLADFTVRLHRGTMANSSLPLTLESAQENSTSPYITPYVYYTDSTSDDSENVRHAIFGGSRHARPPKGVSRRRGDHTRRHQALDSSDSLFQDEQRRFYGARYPTHLYDVVKTDRMVMFSCALILLQARSLYTVIVCIESSDEIAKYLGWPWIRSILTDRATLLRVLVLYKTSAVTVGG